MADGLTNGHHRFIVTQKPKCPGQVVLCHRNRSNGFKFRAVHINLKPFGRGLHVTTCPRQKIEELPKGCGQVLMITLSALVFDALPKVS